MDQGWVSEQNLRMELGDGRDGGQAEEGEQEEHLEHDFCKYESDIYQD